MEFYRSLVIRNISAEDLQDVRRMFRMKVYALTSISGDPFIPAGNWNATTVDYEGGTNPTWETQFSFTLHDPSLHRNLQHLNFQFHCERSLGDKIVGEVSIPVKGLFDKVGNHNVSGSGCYPVKRPSGGLQGAVKFTFEFGEPLAQVVKPPRSQPPPRPQAGAQSTVNVELNLNISGDCEEECGDGCDVDAELACDVQVNLNISGDCQQQGYTVAFGEGCEEEEEEEEEDEEEEEEDW